MCAERRSRPPAGISHLGAPRRPAPHRSIARHLGGYCAHQRRDRTASAVIPPGAHHGSRAAPPPSPSNEREVARGHRHRPRPASTHLRNPAAPQRRQGSVDRGRGSARFSRVGARAPPTPRQRRRRSPHRRPTPPRLPIQDLPPARSRTMIALADIPLTALRDEQDVAGRGSPSRAAGSRVMPHATELTQLAASPSMTIVSRMLTAVERHPARSSAPRSRLVDQPQLVRHAVWMPSGRFVRQEHRPLGAAGPRHPAPDRHRRRRASRAGRPNARTPVPARPRTPANPRRPRPAHRPRTRRPRRHAATTRRDPLRRRRRVDARPDRSTPGGKVGDSWRLRAISSSRLRRRRSGGGAVDVGLGHHRQASSRKSSTPARHASRAGVVGLVGGALALVQRVEGVRRPEVNFDVAHAGAPTLAQL